MGKELIQEFIAEITAPPLKRVTPDQRMKDYGVIYILAHTDDLEGMFYAHLKEMMEASIPISVILLTLGENGIPGHMANTSPKEIGEKRAAELTKAMGKLGVKSTIFEFSDTELVDTPLEKMVSAVLPVVRKQQPAFLIANSPEKTVVPYINHSDHRRTGDLADRVAETADITTFYPNVPKASFRPDVDFLTRNRYTATHYVPLNEELRKRRLEVIFESYGSQFDHAMKERWRKIFDATTGYLGGRRHRELYMRQVR